MNFFFLVNLLNTDIYIYNTIYTFTLPQKKNIFIDKCDKTHNIILLVLIYNIIGILYFISKFTCLTSNCGKYGPVWRWKSPHPPRQGTGSYFRHHHGQIDRISIWFAAPSIVYLRFDLVRLLPVSELKKPFFKQKFEENEKVIAGVEVHYAKVNRAKRRLRWEVNRHFAKINFIFCFGRLNIYRTAFYYDFCDTSFIEPALISENIVWFLHFW